MQLAPPVVHYGANGRPVYAEHFDDKIRLHRPPRYGRHEGRSKLGLCTHRLCTEPAVIDRNTRTRTGADMWRALCQDHALAHAQRLGNTLRGIMREMLGLDQPQRGTQ